MDHKYTVADAKERLSKLEFSADEDWQTYPESTYTCPLCSEEISFSMRDFEKHSFSDFSNLSDAERQEMAIVIPERGENYNSFLDFYCPRCHAPVRIYYLTWAGGRYTHGFTLSLVVERRAV